MVFTIIILLVSIFKMNSKYLLLIDEVKDNYYLDSTFISELSDRIELLYKNSHFEFPKETFVINEMGDSINFQSIDFEETLFVIRFSEFNCSSCITEEMKLVSDIVKSKENIIYLATYTSHTDLLIAKRLMSISLPVFNIPFLAIKNDMEEKMLPYYFTIDKNYDVKNLFIADPNNAKLTSQYLQYISTILK